MNRTLIPLFLVLVCALPAAQCKKTAVPVTGVVDFISGEITLAGPGEPVRANVGDIVREGMTISTGARSFARITIGENILKIYELTELAFPSLAGDPETTELNMKRGTILSNVVLKLEKGASHRISSTTMIAAVRGTEYLYSVDDTLGFVACYRGAMSVLRAGSDEEVLLNAGEMVYVKKGKKMKQEKIPANFRYKDFEYGKDPSASGDAGMDIDKKPVTTAARPRSGEAGTNGAGTEKAVRAKTATTSRAGSAAVKKSGAAGSETTGRTATIAPKKQAQSAGGKTAGTAASAVKKETAAGKEKESTSTTMTAKKETAAKKADTAATTMTAKKETAAAEVQKTTTTGAKQKQPGALLEKPRVGLPEVE